MKETTRLDPGSGPSIVKLGTVPAGLGAIIKKYGNPEDPETGELAPAFLEEQTKVVDLPFALRLSWRPDRRVQRIRIHEKIARATIDALQDVLQVYGVDYLERNRWNYLGGCFHYRKMIAYDALSTHSWGIAIDLNPHRAGWGARPSTQLGGIVRAFKARGFEWGGDWPPQWTSDPQHFQACKGY